MYIAKFIQQPRERKRYDIDWDCWLTNFETIDKARAEVVDLNNTGFLRKFKKTQAAGALLVEDVYISSDKRSVYFYAEKGEDGHTYKVTISVETNRSQRDEVEFIYDVVDY